MRKYLNEQQAIAYRQRVLADSKKYGVAKTARLYGIHRSTIYDWQKNIVTRKPGPKSRVSWQTSASIEKIIIKLRLATNYGPKRLKPELELMRIKIGEKAIRNILKRNKLSRNHRKKRIRVSRKSYAPYPGYCLQIDTKTVPDQGFDLRFSKARHQFTAIDTSTRIRFCLIYEDISNRSSILFLRKALRFYQSIGIEVERIQTDNHATFTNLYVGGRRKKEHELRRLHPFTLECFKRNIEHRLIRPGKPNDNCFVERSHRTDDEEFYHLINLKQYRDNHKLQQALLHWIQTYNCYRLHSSLNNLPPMKYYQNYILKSVGRTGA